MKKILFAAALLLLALGLTEANRAAQHQGFKAAHGKWAARANHSSGAHAAKRAASAGVAGVSEGGRKKRSRDGADVHRKALEDLFLPEERPDEVIAPGKGRVPGWQGFGAVKSGSATRWAAGGA